jgi:hypothetical protein
MKKHKWFYVTALLCVLHIACNIIWIALNENFLGFDVFEHLTRQERLYIAVNNIIHSSTTSIPLKSRDLISIFFDLRFTEIQYPGLVYLITVLQKLFFGTYYKLPFILNSFYLIVLIFSTYAIGSLCVNASVGCLAAFILSTSPQIAGIARYYGLDYPLMALVAASVLVLLKTNYFQNVGYIILLALLCVSGTLMKGQFCFFMVPAISLVAINAARHKKIPLSRIATLFVILSILIITGTSIWWEGNLNDILSFIYHYIRDPYAIMGFSLEYFISQILFYPRTMCLGMFPFYFFLLVGTSCYMVVYYYRLSKKMRVIFWFALMSYVVFNIIPFKVGRSLFPAYFSYAIMISYVIAKGLSGKLRNIMILCIIIIGSLQVVTMSFGPNMVFTWTRNYFVDKVRPLNADNWVELPQESNIREQMQAFAQRIEKNKKVLILVQDNICFSRVREFEYFLSNTRPDLVLPRVCRIYDKNFKADLSSSDYIIFDEPGVIESTLVGDLDALYISQDPALSYFEKYKDRFVILLDAEIRSFYGEPARDVILAKKIS